MFSSLSELSVRIQQIAQIENSIVHIPHSIALSDFFRINCRRYIPIINKKKRTVRSFMMH